MRKLSVELSREQKTATLFFLDTAEKALHYQLSQISLLSFSDKKLKKDQIKLNQEIIRLFRDAENCEQPIVLTAENIVWLNQVLWKEEYTYASHLLIDLDPEQVKMLNEIREVFNNFKVSELITKL